MTQSAESDTPRLLAEDGKPGCPVTVWDGPYSTRCSLGARTGKCAYHGPFARVIPPAKCAREVYLAGGPMLSRCPVHEAPGDADPVPCPIPPAKGRACWAEAAREHRAARGWADPSDTLRLPALDEAVRRHEGA